MSERPNGTIENGREFLRRLAEHYDFECEAGSLRNCVDFMEVIRCFDNLVEEYDNLAIERDSATELLRRAIGLGTWNHDRDFPLAQKIVSQPQGGGE